MAEEHDAVAVGRGGRRVVDDDGFAVDVFRQLVELVEVGVGRLSDGRNAACLPAARDMRFSTFSCATIDARRVRRW